MAEAGCACLALKEVGTGVQPRMRMSGGSACAAAHERSGRGCCAGSRLLLCTQSMPTSVLQWRTHAVEDLGVVDLLVDGGKPLLVLVLLLLRGVRRLQSVGRGGLLPLWRGAGAAWLAG